MILFWEEGKKKTGGRREEMGQRELNSHLPEDKAMNTGKSRKIKKYLLVLIFF